jgi:hypothetical protein
MVAIFAAFQLEEFAGENLAAVAVLLVRTTHTVLQSPPLSP